MRILIERGSYHLSKGWIPSKDGGLYAAAMVDEDFNQIGESEVSLGVDEIPKAIRRILEREVKE